MSSVALFAFFTSVITEYYDIYVFPYLRFLFVADLHHFSSFLVTFLVSSLAEYLIYMILLTCI